MEEEDTQQEPASGAPNIEPVAASNPCNIVKGKRTKRQRPHSPIPFMITTAIPITNIAKSEEASSDICSNVQDAVTIANTATSSDEDYHWCSTEEEEDMANCLILLAQGQAREVINESPKQQPVNEKYTSRKYMENPNGSKTGYYVYECRTCFKTFPSFQALGGHRASHKRPKKDEDTTRSNNLFLLPDDDNNINYHASFRTNPITNPNPYSNNLQSSSLSLQLTNRSFYETDGNHSKKSRVHECSICGAEFSSGQALGGHMRRHRGPVGTVGGTSGGFHHGNGYNHGHHHGMQQSPVLSFTRLVMDSDNNGDHQSSMEASKLNLDLDLNLPAPSEEESKIQLELKNLQHEEQQQREPSLPPPPAAQQQEKLDLSPPTLVDCHY